MNKGNFFIGIFLVSLATLLLELSLTRVMSVALWYHFGFLVISTALLGFGTAGVVLASWKKLREEMDLSQTLSWLSLVFGAITIFSFWALQQIPFNPFSVATDKRQLFIMPLYYITISIPFFISGLIISLLFTRLSGNMSRLYAVDLIGAALGCLLIVLTMPGLGGSGSVVMAAALGTLAAFAFSNQRSFKTISIILAGCIAAFAFVANDLLPITISKNKRPATFKNVPIFSAWNTFSYIELFERKKDEAAKLPGSRRFVIDGGTAATGMNDLSDGIENYFKRYPDDTSYLSVVSYLHIPNPSILNIGSGAGAEVLDGLYKNAKKITCVEINPIINDVVKNKMNDFWGGLFNHPTVQLVTEEGRNFINRSNEQYDVIVSSHTISNAAVSSGALSLAENYVLTREAFQEYYEHLTPEGTIFFTRPEMHLPRLFTTAREVLAENGVTDFTKHFYAFREPTANKNDPSFFGIYVMKKTPFTHRDVQRMDSLVNSLRSAVGGKSRSFEMLYSPYGDSIDNIYDTILKTPDIYNVYKSYNRQLEPATDDRPFFNQHVRWSSIGWKSFNEVFSQDNPLAARMALENKPVAEVTLLLILLQSVVLAAALMLIPLFRFSREGLQFPDRWRYLAYFACLGLGFIMIEISFIQRFILYLGQPVYTLAVIIAGLLLSTGIGSYLSGKLTIGPTVLRTKYIPALLGVLLVTSLLTPTLFDLTIHWPLVVRIIFTLLLLSPMGILLGIPFPTGIKAVAEKSNAFVPWAWGVNGFFTVIGSVGAVILGMMLGFKIVILLAGVVYLAALFLVPSEEKA
ncbi:spermine/spermidine synthase domain-containing protein [Flavitalea antarctica]